MKIRFDIDFYTEKMFHAKKTFCFIIACVCIVYMANGLDDKERQDIGIYTFIMSQQYDDNPWKKDSCGCLGLRTPQMADEIIKENNLLNKSIEELEKYFGSPNFIRTIEEDVVIWGYYYNTECDKEMKIIQGTDNCWIDFVFENDTIKDFPTSSIR